MATKSTASTASVMTSKSSSYMSSPDDTEDRDVLAYSNGKAALHHVLSEVLCQPWWLLAEALERSGFNEIQDILLMNQAERDMLTFLDANGVVTPLPQVKKNKLLDIKLFSSYREHIGRLIKDWMEISKADFNSVALYMEEEKLTIPCRTMESHANTIKPRNVTSVATVTPTPTIDYSSASPDVKVIDTSDIKATDVPEIKAVNSPLVDQTVPKSPTYYEVAPVKQQDTLHDFFHYIDQGTFGIPCRGKIYCPLPGMDPVAWPREKSACLPRTLAQLARQDFKKEPPDGFAIMLSPQYPIVPLFL